MNPTTEQLWHACGRRCQSCQVTMQLTEARQHYTGELLCRPCWDYRNQWLRDIDTHLDSIAAGNY